MNNNEFEEKYEYRPENIRRKKIIMNKKLQEIAGNKINMVGSSLYNKAEAIAIMKAVGVLKNTFVKEFKAHYDYGSLTPIYIWLYSKDKKKYIDNASISSAPFTAREVNMDNIFKPKPVEYYITQGNGKQSIQTLKENANYFLKYNDVIVHVYVAKDTTRIDEDLNYPMFLYISFIGLKKNAEKYEYNKFIKEVRLIRDKMQDSCNGVYNPMVYKYDKLISGANSSVTLGRPMESVFINKADKDKISTYINKYIDNKERLSILGIYPKASIMLYGEPGTGKTSLIKAIATEHMCNIFTVNLSNIETTINAYKSILSNDNIAKVQRSNIGYNPSGYAAYSNPGNINLLVFEDIDYIFGKREEDKTMEEKENANNLLQVLDGLSSIPNTITIATTNKLDTLDEAIVREGRFDLKINMSNINKTTAKEMCKYYNADLSILDKEKFPINPSYLQTKIVDDICK